MWLFLDPYCWYNQKKSKGIAIFIFVPVKKVSLYCDTVWILLIMQVFINFYFLIHGAEMYYSCKNMIPVTG
jgi:hypothetical protein